MEPLRNSFRPLHLVRIEAPTPGLEGVPSAPDAPMPGREILRLHPRGEEGPEEASRTELLSPTADAAFLLESPVGDTLLVGASSVRRIPYGDGGAELIERAAEGARRWQMEQERVRWRCALVDQLIEFWRSLDRATQPSEVYDILAEQLVRVVGGFTTLIFARDPMNRRYYAVENPRVGTELWKLSFAESPDLLRPGTIGGDDTRAEIGAPFTELGPLFEGGFIASAAHLPFADDHLLFLLERRQGRTLDPEQWNLLSALAGHAETALTRIRLFDELRSLSLTDSLTGLANRRQMNLVLERTLSAARRGHDLALVILDVDGFKEINDSLGHQAGDRVLCHMASTLRGLVRGSDLVIRYGGDEFLLVLPDGDRAGAEALVARIRDGLPETSVSAGIAVYDRSIQTVSELVERADQSLLDAKRRRLSPPSRATAEAPRSTRPPQPPQAPPLTAR